MDKKMIRFEGSALSHLEFPYYEAKGSVDGPTLTLIAGIHGCEYTSQRALRSFMETVDESVLRGRIRAISTVNVEGFYERSPFLSPSDGLNLNRCFPGAPDGSYSMQLSYAITEHMIKGSDFFADLHAGDMVEDLTPFTMHESSSVDSVSRTMAKAYGFPYCVRQPAAVKTVSGASTAAAAALGIPAIIAESGGRGLLEAHAVAAHVAGLDRMVRALELLPDDGLDLSNDAFEEFTGFDWLRAERAGWWESEIRVGDRLTAGQRIGTVVSLLGEPQEVITAPNGGVAIFLTSSPAVKDDGLLIGIATA